MKTLFLIFLISAFISSVFGQTDVNTHNISKLVIFGAAKRTFFTNVSQIMVSVNCQIPFGKENATKGDLANYLESHADECGNKINSILADMKLGGCEDSQYENELSKGNLIKSSFVFTPLYDIPRHSFKFHPRRALHYLRRHRPHSPRRPTPTPFQSSSMSTLPNAPDVPFAPRRHFATKPKLIGYVARQMIQICAPTAEAGLLMDQLVQNNATIYRVRSILPHSSLVLLRNAAIKESINDALQQADIILDHMGVKRLSYLVEFSRVIDPHFASIDAHAMAFLPRLSISKRDIKANIRLVVRYVANEEEAPKKIKTS